MLHGVLQLVETLKQQAERLQSQMITLAGLISASSPFHFLVVMGYTDNKNSDISVKYHISVKHCVIAKYETRIGVPLNSIKRDPISNKTYLHLLDPDLFLVRIKLLSLLDAKNLNTSDFIQDPSVITTESNDAVENGG